MKNLNILASFQKHMDADHNYGYDNLSFIHSGKGTFILKGDEDGGDNNQTLIMYSVNDGWLMEITNPILMETINLFIDMCNQYYAFIKEGMLITLKNGEGITEE